jgi:hypothetical protein
MCFPTQVADAELLPFDGRLVAPLAMLVASDVNAIDTL